MVRSIREYVCVPFESRVLFAVKVKVETDSNSWVEVFEALEFPFSGIICEMLELSASLVGETGSLVTSKGSKVDDDKTGLLNWETSLLAEGWWVSGPASFPPRPDNFSLQSEHRLFHQMKILDDDVNKSYVVISIRGWSGLCESFPPNAESKNKNRVKVLT